MGFQLWLVVAVTIAVVAGDTKTCKCKPDADDKAFWAHLASLSKKIDKTKDKSAYAVLPALLSPLVDCNCHEKTRPKRKIMPPVPDTKLTHPHKVHKPKAPFKTSPIRHLDRTCPLNFARVGYRCIPEDQVDKVFE